MEPIDRAVTSSGHPPVKPRPRGAATRIAAGTLAAACLALGVALMPDRGAAQSAPEPLPPPARDTSRMAAFLHEASRPASWAEPLGYSVYDQLADKPDAWDGNADGYARRLGSHAGRTAVSLSVRHGVASLLRAPARPVRCPTATGEARIAEAALSPVADRGCDGAVRIAVPRIAARVASAFAPLAWHQPDYNAEHAVTGIATGVVSAVLLSVAKVVVLGK
jgi:hypothetical protein